MRADPRVVADSPAQADSGETEGVVMMLGLLVVAAALVLIFA